VTLGDGSERKPFGTVKDIPIHLPPLYTSDFLVIDMEKSDKSLVILG